MTNEAAVELFLAIRAGDVDAVDRLLDRNPGLADALDSSGATPVLTAVYHDQRALIPSLAARRPLSLVEAAAAADLSRMRALLAADPAVARGWSEDGWTPLHLAAFFRHSEAVELLLDLSELEAVSRNAMAVTPLQSALAARAEEIALRLLSAGADPNAAAADSGWRPLHYCAANQLPRAAAKLIAQGADRTLPAPDGRTAVEMAEAAGNGEVAAILRATP